MAFADHRTITGDEANELLEANAHFADHLYSYITPMSLNCAVQLGIPDTIHRHGSPMSLSDLAGALPIHPQKAQFLPQLMRLLTHAGYFTKHPLPGPESDEPVYGLTPVSRLLLADHPFSVKPYVSFVTSQAFMETWIGLGRWFKSGTDTTPFHTAHGMAVWERTGKDAELNRNINEAMAGDSRMVARVLVAKEGELGIFGGVGSLVDVGGGIGEMARALAGAYPEMECTVLDLPQVVEGLEGTPNLRYVAGDMFVDVPSADAVLLKWLLHDWDDKDSVKILKQCRKAITSNTGTGANGGQPAGKVIIIEIVMNDDDGGDDGDCNARQTQLFYDMQMMGILAGKERTEREWKKLFDDAGFTGGYKVYPVLGFRSVIEVYP